MCTWLSDWLHPIWNVFSLTTAAHKEQHIWAVFLSAFFPRISRRVCAPPIVLSRWAPLRSFQTIGIEPVFPDWSRETVYISVIPKGFDCLNPQQLDKLSAGVMCGLVGGKWCRRIGVPREIMDLFGSRAFPPSYFVIESALLTLQAIDSYGEDYWWRPACHDHQHVMVLYLKRSAQNRPTCHML